MPILMAAALSMGAVGDVTEASVHCSPGKPMTYFEAKYAAEEIVARKEGGKAVLLVRVNVPRQGVTKFTEAKAELTAEEWDSVVEIVTREKLLDWKPDPQGIPVFDWGAFGFRVAADKTNGHTWTEPLKNGGGPGALSKRLAALAAEKVATLKLFYLRPN